MRKQSNKIVLFIFVILMTYYIVHNMPNIFDDNLNSKYILLWRSTLCPSVKALVKYQNIFLETHCPVNNCYVTTNRNLLKKITDFDAILFHGPELENGYRHIPKQRAKHQQYIFTSREPPQYYPMKNERFNNFFNWTWTYRLDSEVYFGYFIVRNVQGEVIGPRKEMSWLDIEEMKSIEDKLKKELSQKNKAAAWFVSNCKTPGGREIYVLKLIKELAKYNMTLDVYGKCGRRPCPGYNINDCNILLKKWYYFYLSFENSICEDYVTEKLLTALLNNAVPIVYGGADYTRFLPDGAYLNALQLGIQRLVRQMFLAINDSEIYYRFFKWRNHYSYHITTTSIETNYYCQFCSKVNANMEDQKNGGRRSEYLKYFGKWWRSGVPEKVTADPF